MNNCYCDRRTHNKLKYEMKWIILGAVNAIIIMMTCGLMLNIHFSPDTYDIWTTTDNNVDVHLRDGRFITAALYHILAKLGINVAHNQSFFTIIFILTVAGITTVLSYYIDKRLRQSSITRLAIIDGGLLLIFHNAFIAEWYLFPEVMLMYAVSLASVVVAVETLIQSYLSNGFLVKLRYGCFSLVALILSLGTYQVSIGIYIILLLTLIVVHNELPVAKKLIFAFKGLCFGAFNCFLNIGIVKILTAMRVMPPTPRGANLSLKVICDNMLAIMSHQKEIWSGHHIYPRYALVGYLIILVLLFIAISIQYKIEDKGINILLAFLFCGIIYVGSYIPHFVSSDFWLSQRTLVPIFGLYSFLAIVCVVNCNIKRILYTILFVILTFLMLNSLLMEGIFSNHLAMDDFDIAYAKDVQSYIQKYTERTGNEIRYLAIGRDSDPTWSYNGIKYVSYDMNVKNILRSWSNIGLINTANKTNYQACEIDEIFWEKQFGDKNWDGFVPEEQIAFQDDIAYIAIY